jgi:C4-type Zn-finger protein
MTCPICHKEMVDIELYVETPYWVHLEASASYLCKNPSLQRRAQERRNRRSK